MQTGRELGIPPTYAIQKISVISGKPVCEAALMAALIYRDHGDDALIPVESTDERATFRYKRRGWAKYETYTYTTADARAAGLLGKANWTSFPRDMRRARCITSIAHMAFQDTIGGLYTADELDDAPVVRVEPADPPPAAAPVAVEDVALPQVEEDAVFDERTRANRRYHAIGASHGWTDAALHLFAVALMPERPNGPTTSRSQLTAQELRDLGTTMEDTIGRMGVDEAGKGLPTPEVDFANAIAAAESRSDLRAIGKNLSAGGHGAEWLRAMWRARNRELVAVEGEAVPAEG